MLRVYMYKLQGWRCKVADSLVSHAESLYHSNTPEGWEMAIEPDTISLDVGYGT